MTLIRLLNQNHEFLEELKVKHIEEYILYRGRLFRLATDNHYIQVQYLEVS